MTPAVSDETKWQAVLNKCWRLRPLSRASREIPGCRYTQSLGLGQWERGGFVSQSLGCHQISHEHESLGGRGVPGDIQEGVFWN